MPDPKLMITLITGGVATAAALRRDLDALFSGQRSLVSQMKSEEERIHEIDAFVRELSGDKERCEAVRQALEKDRGVALGRLKRLTAEFTRQREDPNCDLSFMQRVFLLFRPDSARAEIVHWGAWALLAVGLIAMGFGILAGRNTPDFQECVADLALLGCLGFLVLRGWALAERRAVYGYEANGSRIKTAFVAKRPKDGAMFAAQACFWVCAYWMLEALEDSLTNASKAPWTGVHVAATLIKFSTPLVVAAFCIRWAGTEWKCAGRKLKRWKPAIVLSMRWSSLAMVLSIAMLAGAITILNGHPASLARQPVLIAGQPVSDKDPELEPEHQFALLLQALISCLACSQWLVLASQMNVVKMEEPSKAQSAAA